jgi:hypothetical protein
MGTKMPKMEEENGKKWVCMEVFMTKDEPNISLMQNQKPKKYL